MLTISINEAEGLCLELIRVALSANDHEARKSALRYVRHVVIADRISVLAAHQGAGWVDKPDNQALVRWAAQTAAERDEAVYEFSRVSRTYEDKNERRLNIAEHAGKLLYLSIRKGKRPGVQTPAGILHQVTMTGRELRISGARDKDTVRKSWRAYRGIVHLGMAMDYGEEQTLPPGEVLLLAEQIRRTFSQTCPKGTSRPYIPQSEQISFRFESGTSGPRFQNRGLPFWVGD